MELLTTISAQYVPDWGVYEGIRELVQNGLDADDKGFRFDIVYIRDRHELVIYNEGTSITRSNLLLGNTTKRGDDSQRGMYGEGFKVGILALIRQGKDVVISNGINNEIIRSEIKRHPQYGNVEVLCFNTEQTDSIMPIDNGKLIFLISGITPQEVSDIKGKFLHWDGLELGDYYKTDVGRVLTQKKHKGMIFSRGLYVCNIDKLSYGYDFDQLVLGRDRNLASQFDVCWETSRLWSYLASKRSKDDIVIEMLKSNAPDIEYIDSFPSTKVQESLVTDFYKSNTPTSYPCRNDYEKKEAAKMGYTPVFVSETYGKLIQKEVPSLSEIKKKQETAKYDNFDISEVFLKLMGIGWKIKYSPCACGGKYAWMKKNESSEYEKHGCICHDTPLDKSII